MADSKSRFVRFGDLFGLMMPSVIVYLVLLVFMRSSGVDLRGWLLLTVSLSTGPFLLREVLGARYTPSTLVPDDFSFEIFEFARLLINLTTLGAYTVYDLALPWEGQTSCKEEKPNPDIAGLGVRLSTYFLLFAVFISLFIGSFHSGQSGTKELGIATLVNLLSMTINLLKIETGELTPTDVFIIIVMIDTQCVALSATLSSKDALASRLYVRFTIIVQTLAWVAVLHTYSRLGDPGFFRAKFFCHVDQVWIWSIIGPSEKKLTYFRFYWTSYAYDLVQSGTLALCHTSSFDELEKIDRKHQRTRRGHDENETGFSRLPSTAFRNWWGFLGYPIFLVAAVETHLSRNDVDVGSFGEWGQTTAVIACGCGILHWVYVNLPLLGHSVKCIFTGSWTQPRGEILPVNVMRLIAVGAHPSLVGEENYKLLTGKESN